jgi:hypothetical protein
VRQFVADRAARCINSPKDWAHFEVVYCRPRENALDVIATMVCVRHTNVPRKAEVLDDDPPELGDPTVRVLKLNSTPPGGDDRRRSVSEAAGDAGLAAAEADGVEDIGAQIAPLVDLSDFSPVAGKSYALSEGLWGQAFLTASTRSTDGERVRLVEGLGKGAGLALLAVPMIKVLTFTQGGRR